LHIFSDVFLFTFNYSYTWIFQIVPACSYFACLGHTLITTTGTDRYFSCHCFIMTAWNTHLSQSGTFEVIDWRYCSGKLRSWKGSPTYQGLQFWYHQFKSWLRRIWIPFHQDTFSLNMKKKWCSSLKNLMLPFRFQLLTCRDCFLKSMGVQNWISLTLLARNGDSSRSLLFSHFLLLISWFYYVIISLVR